MNMDWRNQITKPSLVVWPERVKNNIRRMKQKADRDGVRLRPHFKTHQSARVARWFREEGGEAITVSSVKMALYFASQGWENITIAFPVNIREMKDINDLAGRVQLNLLITSSTVAEFVSENLENPVGAWIKVDVGYGRTGIPVEEDGKIRELSRQIDSLPRLDFAGILTHAGQSYHISDRGQRAALYREVAERMGLLRKKILADGLERCLVSVG
ncbi:MAG TPA: alanine racemase, partial [Sediminispirochaeta sp.]|nr:alanine racemase [Sediminispirochaeta sp.]